MGDAKAPSHYLLSTAGVQTRMAREWGLLNPETMEQHLFATAVPMTRFAGDDDGRDGKNARAHAKAHIAKLLNRPVASIRLHRLDPKWKRLSLPTWKVTFREVAP